MRADHEAWGTATRDKAAGLDLSPGRLRRLADLLAHMADACTGKGTLTVRGSHLSLSQCGKSAGALTQKAIGHIKLRGLFFKIPYYEPFMLAQINACSLCENSLTWGLWLFTSPN